MRKNYKDDFELLCIRHDYISRAGPLKGEYLKEFKHIIEITGHIMYDKLRYNFAKAGLDEEDIKSISSMYALAYMNLYSIRNKEEQREKFTKYFKRMNKGAEPKAEDFKKAEQNQMITFIRQKLLHCAAVCARKSRDIVCGRDRYGTFAFTPDSRPASEEEIMARPGHYGYRVVTKKEFKESMKRARTLGEQQTVDDDGFKIFKIEILTQGISKSDYEDIVEYQMSDDLKDPESRIIAIEEEQEISHFKSRFNKMSGRGKKITLQKFIDNYEGKTGYNEQVALAKKMLRTNNFMV